MNAYKPVLHSSQWCTRVTFLQLRVTACSAIFPLAPYPSKDVATVYVLFQIQIITGKEHVDSSKFFSAVRCHQRTQRTFIEIVQAKMQHNNQTEFLFTTCHQLRYSILLVKYMPFVRECVFFSLLLVKLFSIVYLYTAATTCGEWSLSINGMSYHKKSWMHWRSMLSKTGWTETGQIWAFSAGRLYSPSTSSTSKYKIPAPLL